MKYTLATRIRLFIALMCLGFGLAMLAVFQVLTDRQVEDRASQDVETGVQIANLLIEAKSQRLRTNGFADLSEGRISYLAASDAETIKKAEARGAFRSLGAQALVFTDADGRRVCSVGKMDFASDLRSVEGIAEALRDENWFGIVERGGRLMVQVSVPARIANSAELAGTVTAFWPIDQDFASEISKPFPYDLAFAVHGKVVAGSISTSNLSVKDRFRTWTTEVNGKMYVAKYAPFPDTPPHTDAGFVVLRQTADLFAPRKQFSLAFISALSFVCLVGLVGGTIFSRSIARSLDGIVRAAKMLQKGEWPERFTARRSDEIGLVERTFNEMSESLRESQGRLLSMLELDPLTELDNHRHFKESLPAAANRTVASSEPLALLLVDIDRFSEFNRQLGHAAGDRKLKEIAAAIRQTAPANAGLARYGGEEFAILLPGHSAQEAEELYHKICDAVSGVTLSAGSAELTSARGKAEGLVMAAELALERAKQLGRNRICEFGAVPGANGDDPMELYRFLHDGTYATVKALAAAVDAKDPYTHGHSDRVAGYAADLAAHVGADPLEIDLIHRTGTLHDVGKIGVPDAILQKPGRLDPEELRIMQSHAILGEFIVAKVPQLSELLPGVRHHHERYDGGGYPDGLSGTAIPRIARFLAIADTFDAMTSDRPYRPGLPRDVALTEIEKNAGVQFDPEFALAFAEMMRKREAIST